MADINDCLCKQYSSFAGCINAYTFRDSGKTVTLEPKKGEVVKLYAIDGCFICAGKRCDCLFLYQSKKDKISFLVELKGTHLDDAFKQLIATRDNPSYQKVTFSFGTHQQRFVIISNVALNKTTLQKLEDHYSIRVGQILHSDPQKPYANLREKI